LATCDEEKEKTLFGPVTHYFAENEAGDQLINYKPQQSSLASKGMLTLSPLQFAGFQQQAEDQFVKKIQREFTEKYPQIFSAFPEKIQINIVSNLFDRAKSWGISWKSSLVVFAELMLVIAPNFDQQSDINQALKSDKEQNNQTIKSITSQVPDSAWSQAEAATEDLPLYISLEYINASLAEQTANAIPLVLWDKAAELDIQQTAENACRYADELALNNVNDAPLTLAVWKSLYGQDFNNPRINPWATDILYNNRTSRERIAMLKYRIALDHGRRV
jgi:hypothetical protein